MLLSGWSECVVITKFIRWFGLLTVLLSTSVFSCQEVTKAGYLAASPGRNAYLHTNECIYSPSRNVYLIMQGDGNLVLYRNGPPIPSNALWNTETVTGAGNYMMAVQEDGNLVVYKGAAPDPNLHTFSSGTYGAFGEYFLNVQDDENVVMYRGTGPADAHGPLWSSKFGRVQTSASARGGGGKCPTCGPYDIFCDMRKKSCEGCLALAAVKLGASAQCVACVVGAVATGGAVAPACAGTCGGAATAEKVAAKSGC